MQSIIFGIFLILHGLVHWLYAGQSKQVFELVHGMVWPANSWALSKWLGNTTTRLMASFFLILVSLGFFAGGLGLFLHQGWWHLAAGVSAAFSSVIFILLWDGKIQALPDKGGVGILINLGILAVIALLKQSL
jgi:hypothetical protein